MTTIREVPSTARVTSIAVDPLMAADDFNALREAKALLEHPGLAARISHLAGRPIEKSLDVLPERWRKTIHASAYTAIDRALDIAVATLDAQRPGPSANRWHHAAATLSGGAGGAFGLLAVSIELPISTTIMLRSIADIARSMGEDLSQTEARIQCVQVLAMGGRSDRDDGAETAYFAARAALARAVSDAASHIAARGLAEKSAPAVVRLITQVAGRFSIVVSEKAAAQSVPVLGALGGAVINSVFISHFQDMARGHFMIRRLERRYDPARVRAAYQSIKLAAAD